MKRIKLGLRPERARLNITPTSVLLIGLGVGMATFTATMAGRLPENVRPELAFVGPMLISASAFLSTLFIFIGLAELFGLAELQTGGLRGVRGLRSLLKPFVLALIVVILFFSVPLFLRLATGCDAPLLAVTSKSMCPTYNFGDLLVAVRADEVKVGDVIAYRYGREIITHRVVNVTGGGFVTKGDAMDRPDPWIVRREDVVGRVVACVPYLGYAYVLFSNPATALLFAGLAFAVPLLLSIRPYEGGEHFEDEEGSLQEGDSAREVLLCPFLDEECRAGLEEVCVEVCNLCLLSKLVKELRGAKVSGRSPRPSPEGSGEGREAGPKLDHS
jgi:signal peptidase